MFVVPFVPMHFEGFEVQEEQKLVNRYFMDEKYLDYITNYGEAWTAIVDNKVVGVGGGIDMYPHLTLVWAILGIDAKNYMFSVTKAIKKWLDKSKKPRMETAVRREFEAGHRWANMLGFSNETKENGMLNFGVDGETYDLYARYN